jgi:hypothetical protein
VLRVLLLELFQPLRRLYLGILRIPSRRRVEHEGAPMMLMRDDHSVFFDGKLVQSQIR